jgi:hypothetical protein
MHEPAVHVAISHGMPGHCVDEVQPLDEDELGPLDELLDGLPEELLDGPAEELLAGPADEALDGPLEELPVALDAAPPEPEELAELELAEAVALPPALLVELVPAAPAPPRPDVDWSR